MECVAYRELRPEDWRVIRFYDGVRDQVANLTPMAEKPHFAPRLEVWAQVLDRRGLSGDVADEILDAARSLHDAVLGYVVEPRTWQMHREEFFPPQWTDSDHWPLDLGEPERVDG